MADSLSQAVWSVLLVGEATITANSFTPYPNYMGSLVVTGFVTFVEDSWSLGCPQCCASVMGRRGMNECRVLKWQRLGRGPWGLAGFAIQVTCWQKERCALKDCWSS